MNAHAAWAHPQLAAQVMRERRDGRSEIALRVQAMDDSRRVLWLEQRLRALPGVQRVTIDRDAGRVRVVWDARHTSLPQLLDNFSAAQCPAQPLQHDRVDDTRSREQRDALKRLLVAGMCSMQVMTYAFVIYIGVVDFVDFSTRDLFRWLGLITSVPVVTYSTWPFLAGAVRELRERRLGINLPVVLAVQLAFFASLFNTLQGSGEVYYDSATMFVFLLLGARYVELRSRHRSDALGDAVIDATPLLARRRDAQGEWETVPAIALRPGDRVQVAEGDTLPADGVLESATAQLDEALLSGESRPVTHRRGERLFAGSMLLSASIELRVERSGAASTSARLDALARRARQARERIPGSEHDVGWFTACILILTALTALGWMLVDPSRAFEASVAVLVVACPCAFALARPAALARALGVLASRGVLVNEAHALDKLAQADCALFDKTGTLGIVALDRDGIEPLRDDSVEQVLQLGAALARESSHPLARALTSAAGDQPLTLDASAVQVHTGAGISGEVDGRRLRLGQAAFALGGDSAALPAALADALLLADENGPVAAFHLAERPRADARRMLDALRADGVQPVIVSGDHPLRVAALADTLHIKHWHARQSPQDKLARLQAARDAGHVTLAVGDGSNDAPVLAAADVSAALDSGTGLAQQHADVLLLNGRLDGLAEARAVARRMQAIAMQSRRWSIWYNLGSIPFAAIGLVPPWLAALGMSLSSLLVALNARRIDVAGAGEGAQAASGTKPSRRLPA